MVRGARRYEDAAARRGIRAGAAGYGRAGPAAPGPLRVLGPGSGERTDPVRVVDCAAGGPDGSGRARDGAGLIPVARPSSAGELTLPVVPSTASAVRPPVCGGACRTSAKGPGAEPASTPVVTIGGATAMRKASLFNSAPGSDAQVSRVGVGRALGGRPTPSLVIAVCTAAKDSASAPARPPSPNGLPRPSERLVPRWPGGAPPRPSPPRGGPSGHGEEEPGRTARPRAPWDLAAGAWRPVCGLRMVPAVPRSAARTWSTHLPTKASPAVLTRAGRIARRRADRRSRHRSRS